MFTASVAFNALFIVSAPLSSSSPAYALPSLISLLCTNPIKQSLFRSPEDPVSISSLPVSHPVCGALLRHPSFPLRPPSTSTFQLSLTLSFCSVLSFGWSDVACTFCGVSFMFGPRYRSRSELQGSLCSAGNENDSDDKIREKNCGEARGLNSMSLQLRYSTTRSPLQSGFPRHFRQDFR